MTPIVTLFGGALPGGNAAAAGLRENQKVSFDMTTGPKGDQASNIKSLD